MEGSGPRHCHKQNLQTAGRKGGFPNDLWLVVREGSVADIESALILLKKNGGNINSRNICGSTPLHIATWRNHIPIVKRLLAAGADPDARDGESGWSSLHRAMHFGHLSVASILLQSGASTLLEDSKSRTPIDLLSGPVLQVVGKDNNSVVTELYSWGSGVNYQLGTGNAHIQKLPCKVDSLHGIFVKLISAAKFHSVAVSARGEVYTWGFGRGGRLGHSDFDIHSGQAAVITPRKVTSGLGCRRVKAIAAAKHHTVVATEGGEVFTWGSNREGQLGYTSVDTQPTPRRVSSLRSRVVSVAAANKHTAVVSESGEVFTWGCNREGQLGYGTSNSASNYTPRIVEYLKGKALTGVSAAKSHTIVLGAEGEVFTWGHRLVTPRRVIINRNIKKSGSVPLKFHRFERLHVVAVAAGMVHSVALTDDGALFYWGSSDPNLRCQQQYSSCGKRMVAVSAGKYWTAAVTETGDVYMWDAKNCKEKPPVATRLHGVKKACSVAVGETHMLITGSLYHPPYPFTLAINTPKRKSGAAQKSKELDEDFMFEDVESKDTSPPEGKDDTGVGAIPSLKSLCEKAAADFLVEPRNCLQLLEIADSLEADNLKKHCEEMVIHNLDYIFTVSGHASANASVEILAKLEKLLDTKSSELWSYRRLPTPTATFPPIIDSDDDACESEFPRSRGLHTKKATKKERADRVDCFMQPLDDSICKEVRALRKKLQQIEMLEEKHFSGHPLDDQQIAKLQSKLTLESSLAEFGIPVDPAEVKASCSVQADGKMSKKTAMSKKQRKKSKNKAAHEETAPVLCVNDVKHPSAQFDMKSSQLSEKKVGDPDFGVADTDHFVKSSSFCIQKKDNSDSAKNNKSRTFKKNKKGGLSMFLSGALDDAPKDASPPVVKPISEAPAWGGSKMWKSSAATLREILDEQSKTKVNQSARVNNQAKALSGDSGGKVALNSFMPTTPIPVVPSPTSQASEGEKNTPPWASSGTPPSHSRPLLRDIQKQQGKQHHAVPHSPKMRTSGFSVAGGGGSPSDSAGLNRWFKPDSDAPSSIRSIQIEEKAMKDLKRFYSSVKVVKNQS